jgi:hypothetical protein
VSVHDSLDQVGVARSAAPGAHRQAAGELSVGRRREGGALLVVHVHPVDAAFGCAAVAADRVADGVEAVADQPVDASDTGLDQNLQ